MEFYKEKKGKESKGGGKQEKKVTREVIWYGPTYNGGSS